METISTKIISDWFSLQAGDWITTQIDERVGVVRLVDEFSTHIEIADGQYVIPHSQAQTAKHYFSQLIT